MYANDVIDEVTANNYTSKINKMEIQHNKNINIHVKSENIKQNFENDYNSTIPLKDIKKG